jgi:hypothetical protein
MGWWEWSLSAWARGPLIGGILLKKLFVFFLIMCCSSFVFAGSVTRSFSSVNIDVGEKLTVDLDVVLEQGDLTYGIVEVIPDGANIISTGGAGIDEYVLRWVVIQSVESTTKIYEINFSSPGVYNFPGTFSMGAGSEDILGPSSVIVSGPCEENWTYGEWGSCLNETQNRTGADSNSCGTFVNRLPLSQSCTLPVVESEYKYYCGNDDESIRLKINDSSSNDTGWDCGSSEICADNSETYSSSQEEDDVLNELCEKKVSSGNDNDSPSVSCTPDWSFCSWESCFNGVQKYVCKDRNNCGSSTGKPNDLTRACSTDSSGDIGNEDKDEAADKSKGFSKNNLFWVFVFILIILIIISIIAIVLAKKKNSQRNPNFSPALQ